MVSIIIPCYNAEKYIKDSLNSLLEQTYSNIEIIIVNDGSTDNSENIIKSFSDSRIKYFSQSNKGQCAAANVGFAKSSGSLIKFYDADDILHPAVIEGQVAALEGVGENCISFIEWRRFFNDIVPETIDLNNHTIHRDCTPLEYVLQTEGPPMVQCGLWLLPRSILLKTGLWDERLSLINDTEFFSRIFTLTSLLKFSDKGYTLYRTTASVDSLSKDFSKKGLKSAILSIDLSAKWLLKIENSERIKKRIVRGYVMVLEWAYPKYPIYVKLVERRLKNYPQKYIYYTQSGKAYNFILRLFGWKFASNLSRIYYKRRYNHLFQNKS